MKCITVLSIVETKSRKPTLVARGAGAGAGAGECSGAGAREDSGAGAEASGGVTSSEVSVRVGAGIVGEDTGLVGGGEGGGGVVGG